MDHELLFAPKASYSVIREYFTAALWMESILQTYVEGSVSHLDQSGHSRSFSTRDFALSLRLALCLLLQVDLLLAQAHQYCDKPEDALSVYDGLIAYHEGDFRACLTEGILLKQQNREAEAEQYLEKVSNMPSFKPLAEGLQKQYPAKIVWVLY
jgi:hypothetical protein